MKQKWARVIFAEYKQFFQKLLAKLYYHYYNTLTLTIFDLGVSLYRSLTKSNVCVHELHRFKVVNIAYVINPGKRSDMSSLGAIRH